MLTKYKKKNKVNDQMYGLSFTDARITDGVNVHLILNGFTWISVIATRARNPGIIDISARDHTTDIANAIRTKIAKG